MYIERWILIYPKKKKKGGSLMHCPTSPTASATWKSILKCKNILQLGLGWRVGDGQQIKFWQDIWVDDKPLYEVALSPVLPTSIDLSVSYDIIPSGDWNTSWLGHLLPDHVVAQILVTPIPAFGQQSDKVFWSGSLDGSFSVKSAFHLLQQQHVSSTQQGENWWWIWKPKCTKRIKMFVWLLRKNRVLTNSVCFAKHFAASPICSRCEQSPETLLHLLHDCYHSRLIWESSTMLLADFFMLNFEEWLRKNAQAPMSSGGPSQNWPTLFFSTI
ncbi:hypothetical protein SLE2022_222450 [Rubroshorea leprosula]